VPHDMNKVLLSLLISPNLLNKRWVYRQYDHMVRTDSVVLPGSDAAVIRVKGTDKALALTVDCNSRYCYLDPFAGGMIAVSEASRNLACSGARPIGLTDCLNFGSPERPEIMWQFREAILGIKRACETFNIPVVGGNVSFYNETSGEAVYPTPSIGMVGLIEDRSFITTLGFKDDGDVIVLLGECKDGLGGSEYLSILHGKERGKPPEVDLEVEKRVGETCIKAIEGGIIKSAHDCSEGGIAVALAESCLSGNIGAQVDIENEGSLRPDALLFGEGQSRIVVSTEGEDLSRLKELAETYKAPMKVLGKTGGQRLKINKLIDSTLDEMKMAWEEALEKRLT